MIAICILHIEGALRAETMSKSLYLEHDTYIELEDNIQLFDSTPQDSQLWAEINKYLYTSIDFKRRGIEWWQLQLIEAEHTTAEQPLVKYSKSLQTRLFASTSGYRVGGAVNYNAQFGEGWGISISTLALTGRDSKIEGVFRHELSPEFTIARDFEQNRYFTLKINVPYQMRGLRSSATQECYTLTHNNLYNPLWGYYGGEVRNSRVVRNFLPHVSARYQTPIASSTLLSATLSAEYGTRKLSRLGWYNASTPMPNYYYKMPSYYEGSAAYDSVAESWQQNNTQYTQIAWDKLQQINLSSTDGEAHYVVEDSVERVADTDAKVLFDTHIDKNIKVTYGALVSLSNRRNYKQMRDLLGGEYLSDIDQYTTDATQTGNNLQNNLRSPNRKITVGERFGYDYTYHRCKTSAMAGLFYRSTNHSTQLSTTIGRESIQRQGHYEKERFPGAASYGDSQSVNLATYSISALSRVTFLPQHTLTLDIDFASNAPLSRNLFINAQNNNYIIDSPTTEKIASATLKYQYSAPKIVVTAEGYAISTHDRAEVWQIYDDISSTYCDAVISGIATRTIGVEIMGEFSIAQRWRLTSTAAFGGYIYTSAPLVTLYDDNDLSMVAQSHASTLEGYIVGNAPQLSTTLCSTYFGRKGLIISGEAAYFAKRYIAPSIVRRSDRIANTMSSTEALESLLSQERLPNMLNINISIVKGFELRNKAKITLVTKVENILGLSDSIYSAQEANRVVGNYVSGLTYGYTPIPSLYQYSEGRTFYFSLKYEF